MTGNKSDDDRDRWSIDQSQAVTLDEILALEEGDAIAVRTILGECVEVFAGRVDTDPPSMTELENALDEYDRAYVLPVETNLWWVLKNGEIEDRIHKLDEHPPYQKALGEPLSDPPLCSLAYREEDGVLFIVPSPVYRSGGRVHHYARDCERSVVALDCGAIVDPEKLIPDDYQQR